jgi:hypothetical protein
MLAQHASHNFFVTIKYRNRGFPGIGGIINDEFWKYLLILSKASWQYYFILRDFSFQIIENRLTRYHE